MTTTMKTNTKTNMKTNTSEQGASDRASSDAWVDPVEFAALASFPASDPPSWGPISHLGPPASEDGSNSQPEHVHRSNEGTARDVYGGGTMSTAAHDRDPFRPSRLHDLETQFTALEPRLADTPEKRALSLLHGMLHETWRELSTLRRADRANTAQRDHGAEVTRRDIANLYRQAPRMEKPAISQPLAVGTHAPDFALPDATGRPVRLSQFRGRPVVLVFYPLDWSPGCSQQLDLYQSERSEFEQRGTQLLAISVDSIYSHGAWAAVRGIEFPLLSDFQPKGEVARAYHVWREEDGFSERSLYVIDPTGVIRYAHLSPFLHHVPDVTELFDVLDRIGAESSTTGGADRSRRGSQPSATRVDRRDEWTAQSTGGRLDVSEPHGLANATGGE
jgi:peroxiredoxin